MNNLKLFSPFAHALYCSITVKYSSDQSQSGATSYLPSLVYHHQHQEEMKMQKSKNLLDVFIRQTDIWYCKDTTIQVNNKNPQELENDPLQIGKIENQWNRQLCWTSVHQLSSATDADVIIVGVTQPRASTLSIWLICWCHSANNGIGVNVIISPRRTDIKLYYQSGHVLLSPVKGSQ